jgi:hypothetical protein
VTKNVTVEGTKGRVYKNMPVIGKVKEGKEVFTILQAPGKCKFGFVGMNSQAATTIKVKTNQPYNVIVHSKGKHTVEHEIVEQHAMRYGKMKKSTKRSRRRAGCSKQGLPYEIAHRIALKAEGKKITPAQALKKYYADCNRLGRQLYDWGEKF